MTRKNTVWFKPLKKWGNKKAIDTYRLMPLTKQAIINVALAESDKAGYRISKNEVVETAVRANPVLAAEIKRLDKEEEQRERDAKRQRGEE